jgi:hypothetical protein
LIEVFDFRKNWCVVEPFLNHPNVRKALEQGMNDFCAMRMSKCAELGNDTDFLNLECGPALGPWSFGRLDLWDIRANVLFNRAILEGEFVYKTGEDGEISKAEEKRAERFRQQFFPRPNTCEWYQLLGGCHYLVRFLQELGKLAFPQFAWRVMQGPAHSLAYGCDETGNIKIIFDILNFEQMAALELIAFASRTHSTEEKVAIRQIFEQSSCCAE